MKSEGISKNVDEYIKGCPAALQKRLNEIRNAILKAAPGAEERISYQMPAYYLRGILVYFAAHKDHIGFYPTASGVEAFKKELSQYKYSKGTIQFPLNKPFPFDLITRIVIFRVKENLQKEGDK